MHKIKIQSSDDMMKALEEERARRKISNIPDTITTILKEHLQLKSNTEKKSVKKKNIIRRVLENKILRYSFVVVYAFFILVALINLANIETPYLNALNVTYSTVHTPTNYKWMQTYPLSLSGLDFGNVNETIYFQVQIHADTIIMENTPVTIGAEASEGTSYAQNVTNIYIGFYGADYIANESTYLNGYKLWTGFAGVTLEPNATNGELVIFLPENGTLLAGGNRTIFWSTAGDKPLSLALRYTNFDTYSQTYDYNVVHVYSSDDLRTSQLAYVGEVTGFVLLLFGIVEVAPKIKRSDD